MAHLKRWLTGIIAVPGLIYIIGPGPRWLFHLLILSASIIGLLEFLRMAVPLLPRPVKILSLFSVLLFLLSLAYGPFFLFPALISSWVILPLLFYLFLVPGRQPHAVADTGMTVFGILYVSVPLALLILIDRHPQGNLWIFFLFSVIFAGDTGALYAGKAFGRHKLYPAVSPAKTWEGAVGGFFCSLIAAGIFLYFIPFAEYCFSLLCLVVLLSLFGQSGDLAESMLKRGYGVKDTGKILPGHGGLLDRIDGLLFSIPVLYAFLLGR